MIILRNIFIFLLFFTIANAKDLQKISLQLQWKHQFEFAGYYMAKEKGFYKKANLDVDIKEFDFGINVTDDVIKGKSTYGVNYPSIILERSKQKEIILLSAILQSSPHALVSLRSSNIKSIKDFKDKRIMIGNDAVETAAFKAMLKSENINFKDMKLLPNSFNIHDLINGKTDVTSIFTSNELFILEKENIAYDIWHPKDYGFSLYEDLLFTSEKELESNPKRVKAFVEASLKGWKYAFNNIDETINLILKKYNTQNKTKEALEYEAKILKELAYEETNKIGAIDKSKIQRILDLYSLMGIPTNTIDVYDFVYDITKNDLILSKNEKEYLKNNPSFKICIDPNWMPYEKIENGKHIGISSNYMEIFAKKLNIKFELVDTTSWKQSKLFAKNGTCDILPLSSNSESRKEFMNITSAYIKEPLVLATKLKRGFIENIKELEGKKIGITSGYTLIEKLKKKYPWLDIVETKDISTGLEMVSKGEIYGQIDAISTINYYIQEFFWGEIKVSGRFDEYYKLGMASNKDKIILHNILEKTVNSLSDKEKNDIYQQWNRPREIIEEVNYNLIIQVIIFFVILILFIIYRQNLLKINNQKLKNAIDEKTRELQKVNRKLEKQVTDRTSQLNDFISATTDFIWEVDVNGRYTFVSDSVENILGFKPNEMIGKTPFDFMKKSNSGNVLLEFAKTIEEKSIITNLENWNISKDGKDICLLTNGVPFFNDAGELIGYRGTDKDITKERNIEDELKNKELILLEQSKMASLGEMLESIAHQWRQPLSVITTAASGTKMQNELNVLSDESLNTNLNLIVKSAKHLSTTIDDFRNFYKKDVDVKYFDLKKSVQSALDLVSSKLYNRSIKVETNVSDITILGFENELIQVFMNIINNSIDVLEEKVIEKKVIKIETITEDEEIVLYFMDNGGGIEESIIDKIFDHKFTTKGDKNGTGIGLYMSKLIVEKSKGTIEASNIQFIYKGKSYKGACFSILLKEK